MTSTENKHGLKVGQIVYLSKQECHDDAETERLADEIRGAMRKNKISRDQLREIAHMLGIEVRAVNL
jgi:ribosomal protein S14